MFECVSNYLLGISEDTHCLTTNVISYGKLCFQGHMFSSFPYPSLKTARSTLRNTAFSYSLRTLTKTLWKAVCFRPKGWNDIIEIFWHTYIGFVGVSKNLIRSLDQNNSIKYWSHVFCFTVRILIFSGLFGRTSLYTSKCFFMKLILIMCIACIQTKQSKNGYSRI